MVRHSRSLNSSRKPDFRSEQWYDLFYDWELIEASFAAQYNIRLRREDDMSWSEFCTLLSGITPETPLGRVVSIRSEKNPKILKTFTPEQKKVRNEWLKFQAQKRKQDKNAYANYWEGFRNWAKAAFS